MRLEMLMIGIKEMEGEQITTFVCILSQLFNLCSQFKKSGYKISCSI
jgi:hypothetical protein